MISADDIRAHLRNFSAIIRTIRSWIWNIRDQMYYSWLCYEGLPGFLDTTY